MSKIEEAKQILEALGLPVRQQNDHSAFPDFKEFKRHTSDIAWETEVWLEVP